MNFEDRIVKLCALAVTCQTEEEAVALARELRMLLHERIESLRVDLNGLSALESTSESTEKLIDRPLATRFPNDLATDVRRIFTSRLTLASVHREDLPRTMQES
jgi:hypothetical protein